MPLALWVLLLYDVHCFNSGQGHGLLWLSLRKRWGSCDHIVHGQLSRCCQGRCCTNGFLDIKKPTCEDAGAMAGSIC